LDKPIHIQFGIYMVRSPRRFWTIDPLWNASHPLLAERLPMTVELSFSALLVSIIVGIPLGIISAVRHNTWVDVITMVWANIGVSMPVFWLGLMLAFVFSILLKDTPFWLPPSGRVTPGIPNDPFFEVWGLSVPESGR
jgi:peptide/nickel transport system permease protein